MAELAQYQQQPFTTVKRLPARSTYDRATVHSILDESVLCNVSYVGEDGFNSLTSLTFRFPITVPTGYARDGESLIFHGHASAGFIRHIQRGETICVSITLLDGFVMARSLFHSSMNYRCVLAVHATICLTCLDRLPPLVRVSLWKTRLKK